MEVPQEVTISYVPQEVTDAVDKVRFIKKNPLPEVNDKPTEIEGYIMEAIVPLNDFIRQALNDKNLVSRLEIRDYHIIRRESFDDPESLFAKVEEAALWIQAIEELLSGSTTSIAKPKKKRRL